MTLRSQKSFVNRCSLPSCSIFSLDDVRQSLMTGGFPISFKAYWTLQYDRVDIEFKEHALGRTLSDCSH
jgi:hypothetical protein